MSGDPQDLEYEGWAAEIEELRACSYNQKIPYTREQDKVLLLARDGDPPVGWDRLGRWWKARDWRGTTTSLKRRFIWLNESDNLEYSNELRQENEKQTT